MIFSGNRNTNGSVGAEQSEAANKTQLSQSVATTLTSNALTGSSTTGKPVVKSSVVVAAKPAPQIGKSSQSSIVAKWQTTQPASTPALRPAGSWW